MTVPVWWTKIEPVWKALTVLGFAIIIGAMLGGWVGLPALVDDHEQRLTTVEYQQHQDSLRFERADEKLDRILCHLEESRQSDPQWERCER